MSAQVARPIVVMGVSAAGKTSVGSSLAHRLDRLFVDGDDLHPAANVAKMRAGIALDDADREPWLIAIGTLLRDAREPVVLACSALKRSYRDQIRALAPGVMFAHLTGSFELLAARMATRVGHFMPASLLASQLQLLEPLAAEEGGVVVDVSGDIDSIVDILAARVGQLDLPPDCGLEVTRAQG